MTVHDALFIQQLQAAFHAEAQEHLQAMSSCLLELEKATAGPAAKPILEQIFREVHSLKGAARAVAFADIERVCQEMENVFAGWKRLDGGAKPEEFDAVSQALDLLGALATHARQDTASGPAASDPAAVEAVLRTLREVSPAASPPRGAAGRSHRPASVEARPAGEPAAPSVTVPATPIDSPVPRPPAPPPCAAIPVSSRAAAHETVRISAAKLDALLRQAEELLTWKLSSSQRVAELRQAQSALDAWEREWARLLPDWRGLQQAIERSESTPLPGPLAAPAARLLEFVDWSHVWIKSLEGRLASVARSADHEARSIGGIVDHLLDDAKRLLMLPFATLLTVLPKMVRDLGRDQGKQVALEIHGGEVEIDKRILEEMKDPLIHLVRNALDHGIEKPEARTAQGKPVQGTLTVDVRQVDGNKVQLVISDDGRGIEAEKVRQAAVRQGLVTAERAAQLDEHESLALIFQSGVSTSPMLTEVSGRGLGMAIVREKVERLGGRITIETRTGCGTTFRILLPLTMATFRGLLVRAADQLFVIPTAQIERVVRVRSSEIRTAASQPAIELDERVLALVWLEQVLELPARPAKMSPEIVSAVVLGSGDRRMAYAVDEVLQEQEVLIKSLGPPLSRVRNVSGAAVLGSGKSVVVLNPADLLLSAVSSPGGATPRLVGEELQTKEKSVLIAEDSITARMLLKNILESAGYHVTAVVDGADAWTALKTEPFDVLVSDIQMPRLNGFDLTARIRGDKKLGELPVVLVTALATREDRERGIDVGANAYIVKSSFDQGNLLEVIRRFV